MHKKHVLIGVAQTKKIINITLNIFSIIFFSIYNKFLKNNIKIKTNSFEKEIKDKEINKWLQRIAWTIPIIISIVALIVSTNKS